MDPVFETIIANLKWSLVQNPSFLYVLLDEGAIKSLDQIVGILNPQRNANSLLSDP